ncbi:MAG TPA: hypothetical protein VKG01_14445 [Thermoanaerobaculia bacterium]|nr:hypothetical protein [Thermoanaerobaculia bacterium]
MKIRAAGAGTAASVLLVFMAALALRLSSLTGAFRDGQPQLVPLDDLYHAKRILYSAAHFPRVLDFDAERGLQGSFCPWPPLYDLASAGLARLLGARSTLEVLRLAAWFPPVFTSLFAAFAAAVLARRAGIAAGLAGGLMLALSPPLGGVSRIGTIDHHFLEPALVLGVVAATASAVREPRGPSSDLWRGVLLGAAIAVALFVQTALIVAAGLALAAVFPAGRRREAFESCALGFALAAATVLAYRMGRPEGYPDSSWYLGMSHVASLLAAAVACAAAARTGVADARGWSRATRTVGALALGGLAAAAIPGVFTAFSEGLGFFGADPWLSQIQEFRPLFRRSLAESASDLLGLGGGAILLVPFAVGAWRRSSAVRQVLAVFAIGFLGAAIGTARFTVPATGILAVCSAIVISDATRRERVGTAVAAAALAVLPGAAGCLRGLPEFRKVVPPAARPMISAAEFLRSRRQDRGRVLGPWWAGNAFDVLGSRPTVVDNFGAAAGRNLFDEAIVLPLSPREETVARYCREHGVRFLVLENPVAAAGQTVEMLRLPVSLYLRPEKGTASGERPDYAPTRLLRASFWWRAYLGQEGEAAAAPPASPRFRSFRLVYPDAARFGDRLPMSSRALQVWEFLPGS